MTPESVLFKSPKGIDEIGTRAYKLGSRLRQLLIRVDGVKTVAELLDGAGDLTEAMSAQLDELLAQGFVEEAGFEEPAFTEPLPMPAPKVTPAPVPGPKAAAPVPIRKPEPVADAAPIEFNSPVKFKLQDLLIEAMGLETGRVGLALKNCRNRDDLARWIDLAIAPIVEKAGKSKAKAFEKAAKRLVGV